MVLDSQMIQKVYANFPSKVHTIKKTLLCFSFMIAIYFQNNIVNAQKIGVPTQSSNAKPTSSTGSNTDYLRESIKAKNQLSNCEKKLAQLTDDYEKEKKMYWTEINKFKKLAGYDTSGNPTNDNITVSGFDKDLSLKVLYAVGDKANQRVYIVLNIGNTTKPFNQDIEFGRKYFIHQYGHLANNSVEIYMIDDLGYRTLRDEYSNSDLDRFFYRSWDKERTEQSIVLFEQVQDMFSKNGFGNFEKFKEYPNNGDKDNVVMGENYTFKWHFKGVSPLVSTITKFSFAFMTSPNGRDAKDNFVSNIVVIENIPIIWF